MFKTYLRIALRSLYKERAYAAINIVGLGLAIACCFLIGLYLHNELGYDSYHADHSRIVRVVKNLSTGGESNLMAATSPQIAPLYVNNFSGVAEYVRFQPLTRRLFRHQDVSQYWDDIYIADENALEFFTHNVLYGDAQTALMEPNSIAISESFAQAFFGDRNPVNQIISTDTNQFRVTAVFENQPRNSHLKYDVLLSRRLLENDTQAFIERATPMNLAGTFIYTYLKLAESSTPEGIARELNEFEESYAAEALLEVGISIEYFTQGLSEIHYDSRWYADQPTGNVFYLYGLAAVAIFIFLIACINYTNISVARAAVRQEDFNTHKILGAERAQLATSFLLESLLHVGCALFLALLCIEFARSFPELESLLAQYSRSGLSIVLLLSALVVGALAGAYPAYCLSAIKQDVKTSLSSVNFRRRTNLQRVLIFIQFTVSISIVLATTLMSSQLYYVAEKPLGFSTSNRIMVDLTGAEAIARLPAIRNQLLASPHIVSVTEASHRLDSGRQGEPNYVFDIENQEGVTESIGLVLYDVGPDYLDLMEIDLIAGRNFLPGEGTNALLVNESLVQRMGWDNPVGRFIGEERQVVGVVRDFHLGDLYRTIEPQILQLREELNVSELSPAARSSARQTLYIQLAENSSDSGLDYVENLFGEFQSERPFEFKFFDTALAENYASDQSLVRMTGVFALVSILISSMGMLCITALNMQQSMKEIGIRKVLGATAWQIVHLFVGRQVYLILGGGLLASLISYSVVIDWLTSFAYRLDIDFWVFPAIVLGVTAMAMALVGLQSFLIARTNPVNSLRYE